MGRGSRSRRRGANPLPDPGHPIWLLVLLRESSAADPRDSRWRGPGWGGRVSPIIIVAIEIGAQRIRVPALVDSGADNTLVPAAFIAPLGVDFATLPAGPGGLGPGGGLDVRPCTGVIRWEREKVVLMTSFLVAEPGKGPDTVLLGRADFFRLYVPRFQWHRDPPVFDLDPVSKNK